MKKLLINVPALALALVMAGRALSTNAAVIYWPLAADLAKPLGNASAGGKNILNLLD